MLEETATRSREKMPEENYFDQATDGGKWFLTRIRCRRFSDMEIDFDDIWNIKQRVTGVGYLE